MLEDRNLYWEAYREVTALPTEEFHAITLYNPFVEYVPLHFECVYCRESFPTLAAMQAHYDERRVGSNVILIPLSRRGYTEKSWALAQERFNAPTIRTISKD
jgi:hypothetical protein